MPEYRMSYEMKQHMEKYHNENDKEVWLEMMQRGLDNIMQYYIDKDRKDKESVRIIPPQEGITPQAAGL